MLKAPHALFYIPIILCSVLTLSACNATATTPSHYNTLNQTHWTLKSKISVEHKVERPLELTFTAGRMTGFSGCNSYAGDYISHSDGTMALGRINTSRMSCSPEVNKMEQRYMQLLTQARMFSISRGHLQLLSAKRKVLLTFKKSR